jgi:hypothetical protein
MSLFVPSGDIWSVTETKLSFESEKSLFCFAYPLFLCTFASEASRADTHKSGLANRAIALSHGGQGTMRKQHYSLQKQKRYATKHLLHQVRSAIRRHANHRVSKRLQPPGW